MPLRYEEQHFSHPHTQTRKKTRHYRLPWDSKSALPCISQLRASITALGKQELSDGPIQGYRVRGAHIGGQMADP